MRIKYIYIAKRTSTCKCVLYSNVFKKTITEIDIKRTVDRLGWLSLFIFLKLDIHIDTKVRYYVPIGIEKKERCICHSLQKN